MAVADLPLAHEILVDQGPQEQGRESVLTPWVCCGTLFHAEPLGLCGV